MTEEERKLRYYVKDPNHPPYHKFGKYINVPLTARDEHMLKKEFPDDWEDRIEALSEHIHKTGKEYKDCLSAIRVRARLEKKTK